MSEQNPLKEVLINEISAEDMEKYKATFEDVKKLALDELEEKLSNAPENGVLKDEINKLIDEVKKEEFQEKVIQMWNIQNIDLKERDYKRLAEALISRANNNLGIV